MEALRSLGKTLPNPTNPTLGDKELFELRHSLQVKSVYAQEIGKKLKLSLFLTKHYAIKAYGNGCIHSRFLTSALVGGEWSA
jgi:hypothetical protein